MFEFLCLILLGSIAYFLWKISMDIPDIVFRIADIQREVAQLKDSAEAALKPKSETADNTTNDGENG